MKKYIVECLGTFTLTFVVILSITHTFPVSTPVMAGLTLALFVYFVGHISGAHINPAVTIGALSIQKIKPADAIMYIVAQVVGALFALMVLRGLFNVVLPQIFVINSGLVLISELIGAFFFTFGIASVIYGNVSKELSGLVIGSSLFLGIFIAITLGSNGLLNPAVALGIRSFNWSYLFGPIIGSVLGMQAYRMLDKKV